MRVLLRTVLCAALAASAGACMPGSGRPNPGPPPVMPASGPLPIVPMSLVFVGPREAGESIGALLPDGTIVTKHGRLVARLLPDRVILPDGSPKIVVSPNGDVWLDPQLPPMRFDGRDALVSPKGEVIWVDDAGTPTWVEPGGRGAPPMQGVRFTPFTPAARRTAEVLLVVLMEAAWSRPLT